MMPRSLNNTALARSERDHGWSSAVDRSEGLARRSLPRAYSEPSDKSVDIGADILGLIEIVARILPSVGESIRGFLLLPMASDAFGGGRNNHTPAALLALPGGARAGEGFDPAPVDARVLRAPGEVIAQVQNFGPGWLAGLRGTRRVAARRSAALAGAVFASLRGVFEEVSHALKMALETIPCPTSDVSCATPSVAQKS